MSIYTSVASSHLQESSSAISAIKSQLSDASFSLIVIFFSASYDKESLITAIECAFPNVNVIGCTTAGEIGFKGYANHSISVVAFSKEYFNSSLKLYKNLSQLNVQQWHDDTLKMQQMHNDSYSLASRENTFTMLLIDGLSAKEEPFTRVVSNAVSPLPLVGGSAGDDLKFESTFIYYQGEMYTDSAVLAWLSTPVPFSVLKSQHVHSTPYTMVVTDSIPEQRIVKELNGRPAADEYVRALNLSSRKELTAALLAQHPVVVLIGKEEFVRSIQRINDDGSFTFYCAVDNGIVLRLAINKDLHSSLVGSLSQIEEQLGGIHRTIMFDCILRRVELIETDQLERISQVLKSNHSVGFSTYGEQINGLHVNQTCTGIAIGKLND